MDEEKLREYLARDYKEQNIDENVLLYKHLKMICPAFGCLKVKDGWTFLDNVNPRLSGTPFFFMITGDEGMTVMYKPGAVKFGKAMVSHGKL